MAKFESFPRAVGFAIRAAFVAGFIVFAVTRPVAADGPNLLVLKPGPGVRRTERSGSRRLGRRRRREHIAQAGPEQEVKIPDRHLRHRTARHDTAARSDRRPFPHVFASLQRNIVG